ncbi:Ion transport protein-domain-containing protein [Lactifluus subvellereus]|nr:Ion transport protein-domain-containing protein [Lactifluus subvellereus]
MSVSGALSASPPPPLFFHRDHVIPRPENIRGPRDRKLLPQCNLTQSAPCLNILQRLTKKRSDTSGDANDALDERKAIKANSICDGPSYDPQVANASSDGHTDCAAHTIFQPVLLVNVIGGSWFDIAESAFGLTLMGEFIIKVVADGFLFTLNAYVRCIWNTLDFFIMVGLFVNVTTGLVFIGDLSRFTRALKALRELKLITLIEKTRSTFESLVFSGILCILDAALLVMLYTIHYVVNGGPAFAFSVPHVWVNATPSTRFSFDSFRASLLIVFEIVLLGEGWIDVMNVLMGIMGRNQQLQTNASQVNAIFFVIYNLLVGVVNPHAIRQSMFKLKRRDCRLNPTFRTQTFAPQSFTDDFWSKLQTPSSLNFIPSCDFADDFFLFVTVMCVVDIVVRFYGLGWQSFLTNTFVIVATGSLLTTIFVRVGGGGGHAIDQLQKLFLVSIAFKLAQRMNNQNKLFKTAVLSVIISLLSLWLVIFIFVETFSLTKGNTAETHDQNYSTMGNALVMLAFMTSGWVLLHVLVEYARPKQLAGCHFVERGLRRVSLRTKAGSLHRKGLA